jgi:hypothetical protein
MGVLLLNRSSISLGLKQSNHPDLDARIHDTERVFKISAELPRC